MTKRILTTKAVRVIVFSLAGICALVFTVCVLIAARTRRDAESFSRDFFLLHLDHSSIEDVHAIVATYHKYVLHQQCTANRCEISFEFSDRSLWPIHFGLSTVFGGMLITAADGRLTYRSLGALTGDPLSPCNSVYR